MNIKIIAGIFLLMVVLLSKRPLLFFLKLVGNGILGMGVVFAMNSIIPGMAVGYNYFSTAVSAVFGIPGAVLLCILFKIL